MADNNNNNNFKTTIAGIPLATGVGIGLRNILNEGIEYKTPASATLEGFAASLNQAPTQPILNDSINFITNYQSIGYNIQPLRTAWQEAYKTLDPITKKQLEPLTRGIYQASDKEFLQIVNNVFQNNKSAKVQNNLFGKLKKNTQTLLKQPNNFAYSKLEHKFNEPIFRVAPKKLQSSLNKISETIGSYSISFYQGQGGFGAYHFNFASKFGDIQLHLPEINNGMLVEGATQNTKRIAPDVFIYNPKTKKISEKLSRQEYLLKQIEESIIPDIQSGRLNSKQAIDRAINQVYQETIQELEILPNVPLSNMSTAQKRMEQIKRRLVDIKVRQPRVLEGKTDEFVSAFRRPKAHEAELAMKAEGLWGGVSPGAAAQGRFSTINLAERSLTPKLFDMGRRPDQAIRQYQLTQNALKQLEEHKNKRYLRYRRYQSKVSKSLGDQVINPSVKILYVDPQDPRLAGKIGFGEGEAYVRRGLSNILEFEHTRAAHLTSLRQDLVEDLGAIKDIQPNEVIGFDEAGKPLKMKKNMEILGASIHSSRGRGDYTTIHYKQKYKMRQGDKFFDTIKAVLLKKENKEMRDIARSVRTSRHLKELDIIADINLLKKNPAKHAEQILTGMAETFEHRTDFNITSSMKDFMFNIEKYGKQWQESGHRGFIEKAMKFAIQEGSMTPQEFGSVFGGVPYVLEESDAKNLLAQTFSNQKGTLTRKKYRQYQAALLNKTAGGVGPIAYDSPAKYKGAGAIGSLEPRVNEILRRGPMGQLGSELANELQERLVYSNPETMMVHQELGKTLRSAQGIKSPHARKNILKVGENFNPKALSSFIEQGGGYLDPGHGMNQIYIPGADTVNKMRPFQTAAGKKITGNLERIYEKIGETAQKLHDPIEPITSGQYVKEVESHMQELYKQWAPGGKGMGSIQRGKLSGSRFLRGVSEAGGQRITDVNVAGISEEMFGKMMKEMRSSGLYDDAGLAAIQSRFEAGERIGGAIARHPFIGDYSVQGIQFQKMTAAGSNIVLPEETLNINARIGKQQKAATLRLGPLVGMGADKDADIFSAMLVSPDMEKKMRDLTNNTNNQYTIGHLQHQVKMQLFEAAKANSDGLSIRERMIADTQKIAGAQMYVPQVSLSMNEAKRAVGAFGQGKGARDAAFLLEWLEQTPISAKHMSAQQVQRGGLEAMMTDLSDSMQALKQGDTSNLRSIINQITGKDTAAAQMLTQGIELSAEDAANIQKITGTNIGRNIQGVNLDEALQTLAQSSQRYAGSNLAAQDAIALGRAYKPTISQMASAALSDFGVASRAGGMAGVSRTMAAAKNFIASAGEKLIKHHKAIGFGFAGSLALSAILSDPKDTIGPMQPGPDAREFMNKQKASKDYTQEKLHPSTVVGKPSGLSTPFQKRAMVKIGNNQQVNIRARIGSNQSPELLAGQIGNAYNSRLSVDVRDRRDALAEQRIANKLMQ